MHPGHPGRLLRRVEKNGGLFQVLEERVLYCIFRFLGAAQNGKRGAVELGFIAEDKGLPVHRPVGLLFHDRTSFHIL